MNGPFPFAAMRPARPPDFVVGDPARPYLLRWFLIPRNDVFNVYYHRFLRDDDDVLHDHPWPSFSIMISGQLVEVTPQGAQLIGAGDCIYRGPDYAHRLQLINGAPVETLFITGPKLREWGFHCPGGFVHWRDFVAENPGESGRGCGEMA